MAIDVSFDTTSSKPCYPSLPFLAHFKGGITGEIFAIFYEKDEKEYRFKGIVISSSTKDFLPADKVEEHGVYLIEGKGSWTIVSQPVILQNVWDKT